MNRSCFTIVIGVLITTSVACNAGNYERSSVLNEESSQPVSGFAPRTFTFGAEKDGYLVVEVKKQLMGSFPKRNFVTHAYQNGKHLVFSISTTGGTGRWIDADSIKAGMTIDEGAEVKLNESKPYVKFQFNASLPKEGQKIYVSSTLSEYGESEDWSTLVDGKIQKVWISAKYAGIDKDAKFTGKDFQDAFGETIKVVGKVENLNSEK